MYLVFSFQVLISLFACDPILNKLSAASTVILSVNKKKLGTPQVFSLYVYLDAIKSRIRQNYIY